MKKQATIARELSRGRPLHEIEDELDMQENLSRRYSNSTIYLAVCLVITIVIGLVCEFLF